MDVTLVTVAGRTAPVLSRMLQHYHHIGVSRAIVFAQAEGCGDPTIAAIECIARDAAMPVAVTPVVMPWHYMFNTALLTRARQERPDDWFVLADQDEFQVYPLGLAATVALCNAKRYDFVEGCLLDRITADGGLPEAMPEGDLWAAFPLGGFITGALLGSQVNKIVLTRGKTQVSNGQHHCLSGRGCPPEELYIPVHHFKWTKDAIPGIRQQVGREVEVKRLLEHLQLHGRLRLDDPALLVASCDPQYPHWNRLTELRLMTRCFSPFAVGGAVWRIS
jgi:hypothetical protein